jgi:hypothetical protein
VLQTAWCCEPNPITLKGRCGPDGVYSVHIQASRHPIVEASSTPHTRTDAFTHACFACMLAYMIHLRATTRVISCPVTKYSIMLVSYHCFANARVVAVLPACHPELAILHTHPTHPLQRTLLHPPNPRRTALSSCLVPHRAASTRPSHIGTGASALRHAHRTALRLHTSALHACMTLEVDYSGNPVQHCQKQPLLAPVPYKHWESNADYTA